MPHIGILNFGCRKRKDFRLGRSAMRRSWLSDPLASVVLPSPVLSREVAMKRVTVAVLALAVVPMTMALVPTTPKPEEVGLSSERLRRIHEAVQRHIDAKAVSGSVTLVARKGRLAHLEAHGLMDLESKKPMPKDG